MPHQAVKIVFVLDAAKPSRRLAPVSRQLGERAPALRIRRVPRQPEQRSLGALGTCEVEQPRNLDGVTLEDPGHQLDHTPVQPGCRRYEAHDDLLQGEPGLDRNLRRIAEVNPAESAEVRLLDQPILHGKAAGAPPQTVEPERAMGRLPGNRSECVAGWSHSGNRSRRDQRPPHAQANPQWPSPDSNPVRTGPLRVVQRRLRMRLLRFRAAAPQEPVARWPLMAVCGPVRVAM
jgi:hypothetical protein